MSMTADGRTARLLGTRDAPGGGLLLSGAFRDVLAAVHESPSSTEALGAVIRKNLSFKDEHILGSWGSWENFTADILGALADAGFIAEPEGRWAVTAKAVPGKKLLILRDKGSGEDRRVYATFFDGKTREMRAAMTAAQRMADELSAFAERSRHLHPALGRAARKANGISVILAAAIRDPGKTKEDKEEGKEEEKEETRGRSRLDGSRKAAGQAAWYRQWARTAGWHTTHRTLLAWNEEHPDKQLTDTSHCGFRSVMTKMVAAGEMATRPGFRSNGRAGAVEYLWLD